MNRMISLLLAGILLGSCSGKKGTSGEATEKTDAGIRVLIDQVEPGSTNLSLNYSGLIEPVIDVPLSFQLPGTISRIMVDEGDPVRKGMVLAEIDKASWQSTFNAAVAMQNQAQDAYDRMKKVYDNGSLPDIKWEEVKSKLEQANSAAQIAKRNLENCQIKSPINGIVGSRSIEVGASATPGLTCFRIFSATELYARVSAPGNEINKIAKGQQAFISIPGLSESSYTGEADKVAASANTITKTFEVKFKLLNPGNDLKPGMICNVEVPVHSAGSRVLVPIQSVMKDATGESYLFLVDKERKKARKQPVKTGGIVNNKLSVTSGLNPGDWYVVDGQQKLADNDFISFK